MKNRNIIKKLNELLIISIKLLEIDHNSSLIITRKTLEYIVHCIYEHENIQMPRDENNYYVLSNLIDTLKKKRKISLELAELMHKIRKNGNNAAHFNIKNPKNTTALNNIKLLCKVLIWFLKKYDMHENSLYLLAHRRAKIKISPRESKRIYQINESLMKLTRLSIYRSMNTILDIIDEMPLELLLDVELKDYIYRLLKSIEKYFQIMENHNASKSLFELAKLILPWKKKTTPRQVFEELYGTRLDYLKEVKLTIKKRYLL
jgi:hypothetical protein